MKSSCWLQCGGQCSGGGQPDGGASSALGGTCRRRPLCGPPTETLEGLQFVFMIGGLPRWCPGTVHELTQQWKDWATVDFDDGHRLQVRQLVGEQSAFNRDFVPA